MILTILIMYGIKCIGMWTNNKLPDFLMYTYTYFAVSFLMIYVNPQVTTTDIDTY